MIRTLSHYGLLRHLGGGSTGDVYQAEDLRTGHHVAVKVLRPGISRDLHCIERLKREAQAVTALKHPHICAIYSVDESEAQHFVVMELLEGRALAQLVAEGPIDDARLLDIARQAASALEAAHAAGILHRRVKPSNVFLTRSGVKLLDFGLPCAMEESLAALAYRPPEEVLGQACDGRADVFALGVLMYELATGTPPFAGTSAKAILDAVAHRRIVRPMDVRPGLSPGVDWLIDKSLAKHPSERPTALEVRTHAERLRGGLVVV
jgi:serine/threonine protein kinase